MNAVRVAVRLRPSAETKRPAWSIAGNTVTLEAPAEATSSSGTTSPRCSGKSHRRDEKTFTFDAVYGGEESQEEFFAREVMPLLVRGLGLPSSESLSSASGDRQPPCHVTIFAYGQTGSGKTHTVDGPPPVKSNGLSLGAPKKTITSFDVGNNGKTACEGDNDDDSDASALVGGEEDEGDETAEDCPGGTSASSVYAAETCGIAPRVIKTLFSLRGEGGGGTGYVPVRIALSFMELYQEKIYDLLNTVTNLDDIRPGASAAKNKQKKQGLLAPPPLSSLRMRRDRQGRYAVENLCRFVCESESEALRFYALGSSHKTYRGHLLNARSSRSHTLLHLYLTLRRCGKKRSDSGEAMRLDGSPQPDGGDGEDGDPGAEDEEFQVEVVVVDLAGSERLKSISEAHRTGSSPAASRPLSSAGRPQSSSGTPTLVTESVSINKSLLTLGKVISMLADTAAARSSAAASGSKQKLFIPYRDSKLTMLLSNALGGNSATLMVACIHSADDQINESLSTLYYANRTRKIVNTRKVEEDPRAAKIRQLTLEVAGLKKELSIANDTIAILRSSGNGDGDSGSSWTVRAVGLQRNLPVPEPLPVPLDYEDKKQPKSDFLCSAAEGGDSVDVGESPWADVSGAEQQSLLAQLASSLLASCDKLQDVLAANRRLRELVDEARGEARAADAERDQAVRENLDLRARLDSYDALLVEHVAARTAHQIISRTTSNSHAAVATDATGSARNASPLAVKRTKHRPQHHRNGASFFQPLSPSSAHVPVAPSTPISASARGRPSSAGGSGCYPLSSSASPPPPAAYGSPRTVTAGVPALSFMQSPSRRF
jgi:hypothetical protein